MLRSRLLFGLVPLLLVLAASGFYATRVTRRLAGPVQGELVAEYQAALGCQQLRASATLMSNALALVPVDPIGARASLERARSAFASGLLDQSSRSAGRPRQKLVEELDGAFQDFAARCDRAVAAGAPGSLADMRADEDALFRVFRALDRLSQSDYAAARQTEAEAEQMAGNSVRVLAAAMAGAVALSVAIAWLVSASLLRPIKALTASASDLGEGRLDTRVPVFSKDELGTLATTFNAMAERLRAYRDAMQERVLRTQRSMEATLTSAPDPLFVIERSGAVEVRNPAAEALSALPEFRSGLPEELARPLARVLATGEHYLPTDYSRVLTLRLGRQDRHFLPRILAIGDALTQFKGAALLLQDVTKFRLLDDAKTNLVGTVSHELKTPLTGLRMAVYLLLEKSLGGLTAQQQEMLESARDDADRLLRILDSLLDMARLEAGASALERRPAAPAALLEDAASQARGFIAAAGQRLQVAAAPGLADVLVDPERLRHVFLNLLTNASKYSPEAGLIQLSARSAEAGFVRFGVEDGGPGIPPEAAAHVFDRFYRVPGQQKPGAGIGLAIAREIVVAHGGSIGCSNRPEGGSDFFFLVPTA